MAASKKKSALRRAKLRERQKARQNERKTLQVKLRLVYGITPEFLSGLDRLQLRKLEAHERLHEQFSHAYPNLGRTYHRHP